MNVFRASLFTLASLILFSVTASAKDGKLKGSVELAYTSILLDKGGSFYGDDGAVLWNAKLDLWQTGFGLGLHHRSSTEASHVKSQRLDYTLFYQDKWFADESFQTSYKFAYNNLHYYKYTNKNAHEFALKMKWKKLMPNGITPFYKIVYKTDEESSDKAGFYHNWGTTYGHKIPNLATLFFKNAPEKKQELTFGADIAYYDDLGGDKVENGFSHATLSLATSLKITKKFSLIPSIAHQFSMEDTVNDEDETAFTISGKYKF